MDFSIIIPAKNEEHNIGRCLDSINAMSFDKGCYEVLVVDNGSSDRTVEIARERGVLVFEKPTLTISGLRNFGASMAKGKILAFLDADCTVAEKWLEAASLYLDKPEVVSFGSPAVLPPNATWVQEAWFNIRRKKRQIEEVDWHESANVFVQKESFQVVGGFNEELITCEDYDLSFRLKRFGKLLADSRIVAVHHREPATVSEFFRKERWRGKSNYHGLFSHGFRWEELPSMVFPLIHFFLAVLVASLIIYGAIFPFDSMWIIFAVFFVLWQVPLALLSAWKIRTGWNAKVATQLFVLLNVYFLARGTAMLRLN